MKKFIYSLFFSILCMSCTFVNGTSIRPSNNFITKKVNVSDFHGIATSCAIDVKYIQANGTPSVEVYASDNVMEYIQVSVNNGILKIGMKDNTQIKGKWGQKRMEVRVTSPNVDNLSSSSAGDIYLLSDLKCNSDLSINTSSSGNVKGTNITCKDLSFDGSSAGGIKLENVRCNYLSLESSSSANININSVECNSIKAETSSAGDISIEKGHAKKGDFEASSAGDIKAKNLVINSVQASASSAGNISCTVLDELQASASSSGSVNYKGNPRNVRVSNKGVNKIN